jgi:hypothetical protein
VPFLFFALWFYAQPSLAAGLPENVYQVTQSAEQHVLLSQPSLGEALDEVVLRLTANADLLTQTPYQEARLNASRYLQSYYQDTRTTPASLFYLFDPATVNALLAPLNATIWAFPRPKVVIWWLIESPDGVQLATQLPQAIDYLNLADELNRKYGLSLVLPDLDPLQRLMLKTDEMAQGDLTSALEMTESLGAQEAWIIKQDFNGQMSYWRFRGEQPVEANQFSALDNQAVISGVMGLVSKSRAAFQSQDIRPLDQTVFIEGLRSISDVEGLNSLFERYDWIKLARLVKATERGLTFELELTDNAKDWKSELVLSRQLRDPNATLENTFPPTPVLQWIER